ncbi:MAG: SH3 domain-containing protein [Bdellovibrionales bacterium]|nr:SH3 domain-containing protein [Bdellovibrionales bacterium]
MNRLCFAEEKSSSIGFSKVNLRLRKNPQGAQLGTLRPGQQFQILSRKGRWLKVRIGSGNGKIGFIYNDRRYVRLSPTPEAAAGGAWGEKYGKELEAGLGCLNCVQSDNGSNLLNEAYKILLATQQYAEETARSGVPLPDPTLVSSELSPLAQCVATAIINGAKKTVRTKYHGRDRGYGQCGVAVRTALKTAGVYPGGGLDNGTERLKRYLQLGFENILNSRSPEGALINNPFNAPNGSILIYSGTADRRCAGPGKKYGHIEIKASPESYYYDAHVNKNIWGLYAEYCRPLIGVLVMKNCSQCTDALKKSCGVSES